MPLVVAAASDCPRNSQMVTLNYWQTVWKKKKKSSPQIDTGPFWIAHRPLMEILPEAEVLKWCLRISALGYPLCCHKGRQEKRSLASLFSL